MTSITLLPPIVKGLNTVEEPKVGTALKTIEQYLNLTNPTEGVGGANIVKESIKENNLEPAVQTLLNQKAAGLELLKQAGSLTATSGNIYLMETNATTLTLPAATKGRQVGSITLNGIAATKLKTAAGVIYGDFVSGLGEVTLLENQHLVVEADGTNWHILSGESKREQTYAAKTFTKEEAETGVTPSLVRPAFVVIINTVEAGTMNVTVGGVGVAVGAEKGTAVSFKVNPGVAWKTTKKVNSVTLLE